MNRVVQTLWTYQTRNTLNVIRKRKFNDTSFGSSRILNFHRTKFNFKTTHTIQRTFCTSQCWKNDEKSNAEKRLPDLMMDFPKYAFPKLTHSVRNWFVSHFLITPYFDNDFNRSDFVAGAKVAIEGVSHALAEGDLDYLEDKVTPECLKTIRNNLSLFTLSQRSALAVKKEDIYMSFIYQIGILMEDLEQKKEGDPMHSRHVEITFVGHSFPDLFGNTPIETDNMKLSEIKDYIDERGGPTILNYRFVKDFTKGVEDVWTLNAINHFLLKEAEYIE